jgi:hypothetical protein
MTHGIGSAGRRARRLALDRRMRLIGRPMNGDLSGEAVSLPVIQRDRTETGEAVTAPEVAGGSPPGEDREETEVGRERRAPSPEDIAARVYELLRRDVRLGRER